MKRSTAQVEMGALKKLRWAVAQENLGDIKSLLNTGIDVDSKISASGETALIIALKLCKLYAVNTLLDADAGVCAVDPATGKTALETLIARKSMMEEAAILPHLLGNLKRNWQFQRNNCDTGRLVELLVEVDWPLQNVLIMNDDSITQEFLERSRPDTYSQAMEFAMARRDLESVKLMLIYGNKFISNSTIIFLDILKRYIIEEKTELFKYFIEHIPDLNVVSEDALPYLDFMFQTIDKECMQVLLDSKVAAQVRQRFGIDLRVSMFKNEKVDAVELLRNQDFNANTPGYNQQIALHLALSNNSSDYLCFLLDLGVNVNSKDNLGQTAFFVAVKNELRRYWVPLLVHGADVQLADNNGRTVFDELPRTDDSWQLLLAQLAIDRARGVPIRQSIQHKINSDGLAIYGTCSQELQVLKTCQITKDMSLFTILAGNFEKLDRFDIQNINSLLYQHENQHRLHPLYYSIIKTKLIKARIKAWKLYRFKCAIACIISESTGTLVDFDHLIVREICGYLNQCQIENFLKFSCEESELAQNMKSRLDEYKKQQNLSSFLRLLWLYYGSDSD